MVAAFGQKDKAVFEYLVSIGLDPNATDDSGRNAALAAAGQNTDLATVEYLAQIADISARTTNGADAFMVAAERNTNLDVIKAMMALSDDVHAVTADD